MTAPNRVRRKAKPIYPKGNERCNPSKITKYFLTPEELEKIKKRN